MTKAEKLARHEAVKKIDEEAVAPDFSNGVIREEDRECRSVEDPLVTMVYLSVMSKYGSKGKGWKI
jgi:hypothetical protein